MFHERGIRVFYATGFLRWANLMGNNEDMIRKPGTKIGMPKLKRCTVEKGGVTSVKDGEESCTASGNSKKTEKITDQFFTVPVVQLEGNNIDFSNYRPKSNEEAISVAQEVSKSKPPLLKSSRGRKQVLPMKFNDSVLHSWKKDKSESHDDLGSCLADDDECVQDMPHMKKSKREESSSSHDDIYLVKKRRVGGKFEFRLKNVILEPIISSTSSVTSVNEGFSSVSQTVESSEMMNEYTGSRKTVKEKVVEKKSDFYQPSDFVKGDIVWAKCGKNFPAWPAVVIDPLWQAPEGVLRACVPGTLCVMFYGYSRTGLRVISSLAPLPCMNV